MKINERTFPFIIIATFVLFLLLGLMLGLRPMHGSQGSAEKAASTLPALYEGGL